MSDQWISEVIELHRFFESWLSGALEQSSSVFSRFEQALAKGFVMIEPSGQRLQRDQLMDHFWQAYATVPTPFRIEVRNTTVRELTPSLALVCYEEWQLGAERTARISSALLRCQNQEEGRIDWLHVQETWLPGDV